MQQHRQGLAGGAAEPGGGEPAGELAGCQLDRRHGLGEAAPIGSARQGALLPLLALGDATALAGRLGRVVRVVLRSHGPVCTFGGAFLGKRGRSVRDVNRLSRLPLASAAAKSKWTGNRRPARHLQKARW